MRVTLHRYNTFFYLKPGRSRHKAALLHPISSQWTRLYVNLRKDFAPQLKQKEAALIQTS